jgi:hypothetical protein
VILGRMIFRLGRRTLSGGPFRVFERRTAGGICIFISVRWRTERPAAPSTAAILESARPPAIKLLSSPGSEIWGTLMWRSTATAVAQSVVTPPHFLGQLQEFVTAKRAIVVGVEAFK